MKHLQRILDGAKSNERLIVGLMSGTSADGIDCCLVRFVQKSAAAADSNKPTVDGDSNKPATEYCKDISGNNLFKWEWSIEGSFFLPYEDEFRAKLLSLASIDGKVQNLCSLSFDLGQLSGQAVRELLSQSGTKSEDVTLIVSHGHTVCHFPPSEESEGSNIQTDKNSGSANGGSTLQTGEGAVIAEMTDIPVLENLRVSDMAAGGQGAPLVPAADKMLFSLDEKTIGIQNIGGIGNITILHSLRSALAPVAFDTGPGNMLIDLAISHVSKGQLHFDEDGHTGRKGKVSKSLLQRLMQHSYLQLKPPKTTGREEFGECFFNELLTWQGVENLKGEDLVATLTAFTAHTIKKGISETLDLSILDTLYIAGGGSKNLFLMDLIRKVFKPLTVLSLDDYTERSQISSCGSQNSENQASPSASKELADMREAICFAALGNLYLSGASGTVGSVTGARHIVCAGKLLFPHNYID